MTINYKLTLMIIVISKTCFLMQSFLAPNLSIAISFKFIVQIYASNGHAVFVARFLMNSHLGGSIFQKVFNAKKVFTNDVMSNIVLDVT